METEFEKGIRLFENSEHEDALKVLRVEYKNIVKIFGADHPKASEVQYLIAVILEQQCKHKEALYHAKETFEKRVRTFGVIHPETLTAQAAIAFILSNMREYTKGLKIYEEVFSKQRVVLGPSHENTLNTRNNMANALEALGNDVLPIYEEIYKLQEGADPERRTTLITRCNIASQLSKQGKHDEALDILKEVNAIHQRKRPMPMDTLNSLDLTGEVLYGKGMDREALNMWQQVHKTRTTIFGPDHPGTLATLNKIGTCTCFMNQSNFKEGSYDFGRCV